MKIFNLNSANLDLPKYLQLAQLIQTAIRSGKLIAGDALPSAISLASDLHINRHTVMRSFAELIAQGWVESVQRVGYRVAEHIPLDHLSVGKTTAIYGGQIAERLAFRIVRQGSRMSKHTADSYQYNLAGGQPDLSLFPFDEFKSYMSDALSRPNVKEFGYGDTTGNRELREQVGIYLRKSRGITDREIVITNGSQEAMYIVAQLLLQQGDNVAAETMGYPPAFSAFKAAGAGIVAIEQDEFGIIPQSLEMQITKHNIRLIYLTPLHQYPTTVTLSLSRRIQIYKLASMHNIPIIEDDYDHEFHYKCQPLPPMAVEDPKQLVIYVSTLSKIMFPGARIGIMAISKNLATYVAEYRLLINHKSNVLMQNALSNWMKSGGFERHIRKVTRRNEQRRDSALAYISKQGCFECAIPDGGMALWLSIRDANVSASELALLAREQGVYIQHETDFHVDTTNTQDQHLRIGFAGMHEEKLEQALTILGDLVQRLKSHS
ncbi:MAG: GntR family transcriptional regulator/MocR family aminotransferase [Alphaproteobacteria bacterium]|jgi:GntR family transcriptional regulator/MocR family aminotransferase